MSAEKKYLLGLDIGTGSLRAGLFDLEGNAIASDSQDYETAHPRPGWAEQNPQDWWDAAKATIPKTLAEANVRPEEILAISIDCMACTVVMLDEHGEPLHPALIWMDIRAVKETEEVNATKHPILKYVTWSDSPEWMVPKALWLKRNRSDLYAKADKVVELVDWFTWKLAGRWTLSLNHVTCKWNYASPEGGWSDDFLSTVGLDDIRDKWPEDVLALGEPVGPLCATAANELGLAEGILVAQGGIDAHLGAIGLGAVQPGDLALIMGSSTCHIALSEKPIFDSGVWGPYPDAIIPGTWLLEGGQVSTGSIVRWYIDNFAHREESEAEAQGTDVYKVLDAKAAAVPAGSDGLVLLDYWQGNRTPLRDPRARGVIWGLSLSHGPGHVFRAIYEGTAYGTRHILDDMARHGHKVKQIFAAGGGVQSRLWLQIHADVCQVPIALSRESQCMCLGAALCAAVGAQVYPSIADAAVNMVAIAETIQPNPDLRETYDFYFQKYVETYPQLANLMHDMVDRVG